MLVLNADANKITRTDLQHLIDNQIPESTGIEYKRSIEIGPKADVKRKIKFLAGISSFANSTGGDLLVGIRASKGLPKEITPIPREDVDAVKLASEQLIQAGISPRISPSVYEIRVSELGSVLLFRILKSWAAPHRVTLGCDDKFYGRHSAGMYQMDVDQLRAAFLLSGGIRERIKSAHQQRIVKVFDATPASLMSRPWVILHMIPFESMDGIRVIDIEQADRNGELLCPMGQAWASRRFNFDGLLASTIEGDGQYNVGYTQMFRSGMIESVDARHSSPDVPEPFRRQLRWPEIRFGIENAVGRFLEAQRQLGVTTPIAVIVTLAGVTNLALHPGPQHYHQMRRDSVIDRDLLDPSPVEVHSFDVNVFALLRPIFNAIWNAAGWPRCKDYDDTNVTS